METIGERLKSERERLSLSQTAFGEAGGVKKQAQINYESNLRSPDANYLAAIASIGADVYFVITGAQLENIASTPLELAYLRNCRAFKDNAARKLALNALVGMSGYKPDMAAANDHNNLKVAEPAPEYGGKKP